MSFPRLTPQEAADHISDGQTIGFSGFTPAGAAKLVPRALAVRARDEHRAGRPFRSACRPAPRRASSTTTSRRPRPSHGARRTSRAPGCVRRSTPARVEFVDMHLSHVPQAVLFGFFGEIDLAVVEATEVTPDGRVFLTTSVGAVADAAALGEEDHHRGEPPALAPAARDDRHRAAAAAAAPAAHPDSRPAREDRRAVRAGRPLPDRRCRRAFRAGRRSPVRAGRSRRASASPIRSCRFLVRGAARRDASRRSSCRCRRASATSRTQ